MALGGFPERREALMLSVHCSSRAEAVSLQPSLSVFTSCRTETQGLDRTILAVDNKLLLE